MVHRAPDSRLLTNLIANEKEYTKHLAGLFPLSHTALASLSAYAAASPSSPARTITAVVDLLASADDALQRYNHAVDTWRDQLTALKSLEDDLSAVLRDRDILVTRLIKVSKTTRDAHRSSRIVTPLTGLGSTSLASLASSNSNTATPTASGSSLSNTNSKLAQAQAELQACEAHLVAKERELDARRISVARDGLGARCRALVDCGWVWGEMGKQGIKTLQALSANGEAHNLGPSNSTYVSDNSSVTPSQSASQTAARSAEMSHEGPTTSKSHKRITSEPETTILSRTTHARDQDDVTITLPPPHAISELTLPTADVRSHSPPNGNLAPKLNGINAKPTLAPTSRRKRMRRPRRPPSQHITEVSDEDSGGRHNSVDAGANPSTRAPFPTTRSQDTSSEDEQDVGTFKVVENDPFEVIRKSMIGPSPSTSHLPAVLSGLPSADASSETSPSKTVVSSVGVGSRVGLTPGSGAVKRERRTSMAFFGSLRGLFRKPKEKEKADVEWDEGHSSPKLNGIGKERGTAATWVTRTDARMKGKGNVADSDSDATPVGNVGRGTRLRKGRPRGVHESGSLPQDGWVTDSRGVVGGSASAELERSGTRRGTVKRKKMSVADLRGNEQGHTDGEVEGRVAGRVKVEEEREKVLTRRESVSKSVSGNKGKIGEEQGSVLRREPVSKGNPRETNVIGDQHRRTATTTATPRKSSDSMHRRSASMSAVDIHATSSGNESWQRQPPLAFDSVSRSDRSPSPSRSASTKPQTRRQFGNGHATHAKNQSLMSIVADVTSQSNEEDRSRSLDIPRAPGSVLREPVETGKRASLTMSGGMGQGRGRGTPKMPLRSALRNASRTPSPTPGPTVVNEKEKKRAVEDVMRDSVSISSYETGRESLNGEEVEAEVPVPSFRFPPPPVDPPPEGTVVRRKSVRVSLQPTFSPSPPASPALHDDDDDEEEEERVRGGSRREDMWADSTSEEEVYTRARGLLSLAGKDKGKGKR